MDRNPSGPTGLGQLGTWRSGGESPSFPGSGDARRLLDAVGWVSNETGCTLVRVRLGSSDRRTLVRVREHLLGEEPIVGTSIGRDAGPDDPGTFDILVVPDYDPVTVGRTIVAVDDVVGVAATAFESPGSGRRSAGGRSAGGASASEDAQAVTRTVVDEAFDDLRGSGKQGTAETPVDGLVGTPLAGDDEDGRPGDVSAGDQAGDSAGETAPTMAGVGVLDALEQEGNGAAAGGRTRSGNGQGSEPITPDGDVGGRSERQSRSNGGPRADETRNRTSNGSPDYLAGADSALPNGRSGSSTSRGDPVGDGNRGTHSEFEGDGASGRLDRLEERLTVLEDALDEGEFEAEPGAEPGSGDGDPTLDELEDRLAALESTVGELQRRQQRLRDTLIGDPH